MYCAMDQIVSIISKSTYLYGGQASLPLTIRASMFYGGSNAAQHSDRPIALFMASPGLKIIAPGSPYDAKGLIKAAIREDDPVIRFEDGTLWTTTGDVPDERLRRPARPGGREARGLPGHRRGDLRGGAGPRWRPRTNWPSEGVSVEVVDPRSLVPMDYATILASVEEDRSPGRRGPVAPDLQPGRGDRGHRGRGRVLVAAGADRPGHRARHAHPVQPAARSAALPEPPTGSPRRSGRRSSSSAHGDRGPAAAGRHGDDRRHGDGAG